MSDNSSPETHRSEERPRKPAWIAGGVLILIGIVFIVRNVTGLELHNWWALFILIPAIGSLVTAWQMYRRNDRRFTAASRGPLTAGVVLTAIAAVFLFEIDWAIAWPFLLILGGAALLVSSLVRRS